MTGPRDDRADHLPLPPRPSHVRRSRPGPAPTMPTGPPVRRSGWLAPHGVGDGRMDARTPPRARQMTWSLWAFDAQIARICELRFSFKNHFSQWDFDFL